VAIYHNPLFGSFGSVVSSPKNLLGYVLVSNNRPTQSALCSSGSSGFVMMSGSVFSGSS
jgi:hypothetical protein